MGPFLDALADAISNIGLKGRRRCRGYSSSVSEISKRSTRSEPTSAQVDQLLTRQQAYLS
jgi:hypothetical protein